MALQKEGLLLLSVPQGEMADGAEFLLFEDLPFPEIHHRSNAGEAFFQEERKKGSANYHAPSLQDR